MLNPFGAAGSSGKVRLQGDVDLAAAQHVTAAILSPEVTAGQAQVVVDVADVTFMDSTGISAIVAARNTLEAEGVALWLEKATPALRSLLTLVGLDSVLLREEAPVD